MVRELIHDPILLAGKSSSAGPEDLPTARDLLDTLLSHRETCVGMAANMIGANKAIVVFFHGDTPMTLFNPEIVKASGEYVTRESCLSLLGGPRETKRFEKIKVRYQNEKFQTRLMTFTGFSAQIIQHEIDHIHGVLI